MLYYRMKEKICTYEIRLRINFELPIKYKMKLFCNVVLAHFYYLLFLLKDLN